MLRVKTVVGLGLTIIKFGCVKFMSYTDKTSVIYLKPMTEFRG